MPKCNSVADIEAYIRKQINSVMSNEMEENIREFEKIEIQSVVYDAYKSGGYGLPGYYERGKSDSIMNNIESTFGDMSVTVTNTSPHAEGVEYNTGYIYYKSKLPGTEGDFRVPRPFVEVARREIQNSNAHVEVLRAGLQARGLDVR